MKPLQQLTCTAPLAPINVGPAVNGKDSLLDSDETNMHKPFYPAS